MPDKTRIAFVANTSWSIYKFRLAVIRELAESGLSVYVLAPRDRYTPQFENLPGLTFIALTHLEGKKISAGADYRLYRELQRHYESIRPHLIFHYTIKINILGSLAARSRQLRNIGVVTGLGYAFLRSKALQTVAGILYRISLKRASAVWFLNPDDRDIFIRQKLVRPQKTFMLPGEGVDTDAFFPAAYEGGKEKVTFLLIARLIRYKGIYEFAEAMRLLREKGLAVQGQLLGRFEEDTPAAISAKDLAGWTTQGWIEYLGEKDDVVPFIEKADCIVLPSYREGLPLSLLEGASMCKAVIATDTAGCRDIVTEGVNGYLCPVKDAVGLAAKMEAYYHLSDDRKKQMGLAGRETVMHRFRTTIITDIYRSKIEEMLNNPV